jgi:hypothetical protein
MLARLLRLGYHQVDVEEQFVARIERSEMRGPTRVSLTLNPGYDFCVTFVGAGL